MLVVEGEPYQYPAEPAVPDVVRRVKAPFGLTPVQAGAPFSAGLQKLYFFLSFRYAFKRPVANAIRSIFRIVRPSHGKQLSIAIPLSLVNYFRNNLSFDFASFNKSLAMSTKGELMAKHSIIRRNIKAMSEHQKDRLRTLRWLFCCHEVGHAVLAWHHGFVVESITPERCRIRKPPDQELGDLAEPLVEVCMAGWTALRLAAGRHISYAVAEHKYGGGSDTNQMGVTGRPLPSNRKT
jgi:hypothetical protein